MRQEKMLALVWALQVSTEASGAKTGVLCEAARELQQCMASLMTLNRDDIVEAFLRPAGEEPEPSPLQKRGPPSWTKKMSHQKCQALFPDTQESPGLGNLLSGLPLLLSLLHPVLHPDPTVTLPRKERSYGKGLKLTPITLASGPKLAWREITGSKSGGRNFVLLSTLWTGIVMMPKSKVWLASRLWPSTYQLPRRSTWQLDCPTLPGSARKERTPCPKRPKDNPGLLGGMERRDGSTGYCAPKVCHSCLSPSKCGLESGAGALQMHSLCDRAS